MATMLDPRFKLKTLEQLGWRSADIKKAKTAALQILRRYFASGVQPATQDPESSSIEETLSTRDALIFASHEEYSQGDMQRPLLASPASVWQAEFDRYLKAPRVAKNTEVIRWWDENEHLYPHLAKVARDYLAIPGSSVPSERVFSRAGDLITKKRNRLATHTANIIMCLRYWLHMPEVTKEEKEEYNRRKLEEDSPSREGDDESLLLAEYLHQAPGEPDEELEL
jgi:hypothetical protein